ncbi:MAG: MraZ family transcriptional regulator [Atopobiaceae bacterium]|nr:MraZ family transcriptional regulator [Atopobiaceae bacterium]
MDLIGAKRYTLDAKGRMSFPYAKQFDERVYVIPIPEMGALFGFTAEGREEWVNSQFGPEGYEPRNRNKEMLKRRLNGRTVVIDIDNSGRICVGKVPERWREMFNIEREVMLVGNGEHFEIWNPDRYEMIVDGDLTADLMFDD